MNRPSPLVRLLERRTRALSRQLSAAIAGKDVGVHQARVASRRLREALPVLTAGLEHTKAGKAQRKIRKLTRALGTVRELDVTLHLIDELAERPAVPRAALAEVRALVIEDRERRRVWIAGQRMHHGLTGALLASAGLGGLAVHRLTTRGGIDSRASAARNSPAASRPSASRCCTRRRVTAGSRRWRCA